MKAVAENDLIFYRDPSRLRRFHRIAQGLTALGIVCTGILLFVGFAALPGGMLADASFAPLNRNFRIAGILFALLYSMLLASILHPYYPGQTFPERMLGMRYPKLLLKSGEHVLPCQVRLILWNNQMERDHSHMEHLRYGAVAPYLPPVRVQFLSVTPDAVAVTAFRLEDTPFEGSETLLEHEKKVYVGHGCACTLQVEQNLLSITPPAHQSGRYFYRILCSFGKSFHANLMEIGFVLIHP